MRFCLLIQTTDRIVDGNYLRIGKALARRGHGVRCAFIDSLRLIDSALYATGFELRAGLEPGERFPGGAKVTVGENDVVWVLSLGERATFLDKIQLLYTLRTCRGVSVINSLEALMHLKSKYFLTGMGEPVRHPETHASTSPPALMEIMRAKGGQWIAKPPAGSLGREVFLLDGADNNAPAILEHLCGRDQSRYALLQRYVPEVALQGEKRVLVAAGQVVGQYRRLGSKDHRTNVAQGASVESATLTPEEQDCCGKIGERLALMGAVYFAIDLAFPWVIELNVVNPGGLATLHQLDGHDLGPAVAELVESHVSRPGVS